VQPLKVLLLSAEVAPFAKTGGLADVYGFAEWSQMAGEWWEPEEARR
jgi:glycogen synthase